MTISNHTTNQDDSLTNQADDHEHNHDLDGIQIDDPMPSAYLAERPACPHSGDDGGCSFHYVAKIGFRRDFQCWHWTDEATLCGTTIGLPRRGFAQGAPVNAINASKVAVLVALEAHSLTGTPQTVSGLVQATGLTYGAVAAALRRYVRGVYATRSPERVQTATGAADGYLLAERGVRWLDWAEAQGLAVAVPGDG